MTVASILRFKCFDASSIALSLPYRSGVLCAFAMGKPKLEHSTNPTAAVSHHVAQGLDAIRRENAVKVAALGPKAIRALVISNLVSQGFESTKTFVRKPISVQLSAALADGAFVPLKSVAEHVAGASPVEAKSAARGLVAEGKALIVQRGTEEVLVPASSGVLSREELAAFDRVAKLVSKAARSKTGVSLLCSDLAQALEQALPRSYSALAKGGGRNVSPSEKPRIPAVVSRLLSAVEATRDAQTGLSFVPAVVASLRADWGPDATNAALLDAANRGLLELRPEGGINRLSAEELALCPPGPQGTRLSWARRTENVV
jgi:hypothetical protein